MHKHIYTLIQLKPHKQDCMLFMDMDTFSKSWNSLCNPHTHMHWIMNTDPLFPSEGKMKDR